MIRKKNVLFFVYCGLIFSPIESWAVGSCNPDGTITGANTTTITLGTGGCATGSGNVAIVEVGATITPPTGDGIDVGTNAAWTITNNGTITTTTANGISAPGSGAGPITLINTGTIGDAASLSGVILQGGGTITNNQGALIEGGFTAISFQQNGSGTPSGLPSTLYNYGNLVSSSMNSNDVVVFGLGGTAINYATGLINGPYCLVFMESGIVENYGQIGNPSNPASNTSIEFENGGTVTNFQGGQLLSLSRGIDSSGATTSVLNEGNIEAPDGRAISMSAGGTVTNTSTGVLLAGSRALYMDNSSGISSPVASVTNAGTMTGNQLAGGYATIELHIVGSMVTNSGTINGDVHFFESMDTFTMTAGQMTGQLIMGPLGSETATFDNVTDANIGTISLFNGGGGGGDLLTFTNSQHTGGSDLINWETIDLNSNSVLRLSSNLTLGGNSSDTTANLNILSSSLAVPSGSPVISSSLLGPVQITNAGKVDLTNGGSNPSVTDTLTIRGNYIGQGGYLFLNTQVGGDPSPSEKLILDGVNGGSTVTGTTSVTINNIGGTGAQTVQGILVIEALNGATTGINTFSLDPGLRVGAYDYQLIKGSTTSTENWYLVSSLAGQTNFIGPEISVYADPQPAMLGLNLLTLGTLHQRVGEEENLRSLLSGCHNTFNGIWMRGFGKSVHDRYQSLGDPYAQGSIYGFQGGLDLFRQDHVPARDHIGVLTSYAHEHLDISGLATNPLGTNLLRQNTGKISLELWNLGAYWTHFGWSGWYLDAVGLFGWTKGFASSTRTGINLHGITATGSLEGGYPIALLNGILIEPEAQLVYLYSKFSRTSDIFSTISLGDTSNLVGRIGLRMQCNYCVTYGLWQPYLKANLWNNFLGRGYTNYAGIDNIAVYYDTLWVEAGGGFTFRHNNFTSFYGEISYNQSLENHKRFEGLQGSFGVRCNW